MSMLGSAPSSPSSSSSVSTRRGGLGGGGGGGDDDEGHGSSRVAEEEGDLENQENNGSNLCSAPLSLPAAATGGGDGTTSDTANSCREGGQGDEGERQEEEEQQHGRRCRFSFPRGYNNNKKKKRPLQQQRAAAASSSSSSSTMTKRSSLFGSLFLVSLSRGKNSSKNNTPSNNVVVGCSGRADETKKNALQQHHEAEKEALAAAVKPSELQQHQQQQQRLEEEQVEQEMSANRMQQQQHAAVLLLGKFLTQDCPTDVLPRIFAYAGPQMTRKLQQCNLFFHNILNRQGTWRILCEELYKWKPGEPEPSCWKEHYRLNPCVPVDFKSISSAIETVGHGAPQQAIKNNGKHSDSNDDDTSSNHDHHAVEIQSDVTVWLRPGRRYVLPRAVTISTNQKVRIESQQLLPESSIVHRHDAAATRIAASHENKNAYTPHKKNVTPPAILVSSSSSSNDRRGRSRRHNEPLFRVLRGTLVLRNVNLQHYSPGIDIWHGNAAIQVQPGAEACLAGGLISLISYMASATLYQVQVQSSSGRGIVAVDGGRLHVQDSYIHDCAATGVYVGGMTSKATLIQTDILSNGTGNQQCSGGGIARGHSGVYVEQGTCELDDCSVSRNSASGICVLAASAMDGFNIFNNNNNINIDNNNNINAESLLTMRKTDVLANESNPLELPQQHQQHHHQGQFPNVVAAARRGEGETNNNNVFDPQHENNISRGGTPRPRSSILRQV